MSLTGTTFLLTSFVLCAVALLLPLVLWSRVPGPSPVRAASRLLMLLFAQGTAISLVFVLVNNANNLYDNWADLLGTGNHVQRAADLGVDGTGGISLKTLPRVRQTFVPAQGPRMGSAGGVRVTDLKGRVSGVNAEVYVWLPPQYDEPAYRHKKFPVVELLPGYPGSAKAWFGSLRVHEQLRPMMLDGRVAPFILVAPRTNLLARADTGCANIPGTVNAESWLSRGALRHQAGRGPSRPLPGRGEHVRVQRPQGRTQFPGRPDPRTAPAQQPLAAAARRPRPAADRPLLLRRVRGRVPGGRRDPGGREAADAGGRGAAAAQRGRPQHGPVAAADHGGLPLADPADRAGGPR
jgi:hypothetical protein